VYVFRRVQVNQDGLKLNGTHQLLVYVDDVNILGGSVHTVKENTEALVVASKEAGLKEVNTGKTKYMVMSRNQNAGRSHNKDIENKFFERAKKFQYLETTLTNQNSIQKEIKSRLKSGKRNIIRWRIFIFQFAIQKFKIMIYRTTIMPVLLYGCGTWSLTLREEHRLRMFENWVLRKIFGDRKKEVSGEWRLLHKEELNNLYPHPILSG